jgi:hypothetical protein
MAKKLQTPELASGKTEANEAAIKIVVFLFGKTPPGSLQADARLARDSARSLVLASFMFTRFQWW